MQIAQNYSFFDRNHWHRVQVERRRQGLDRGVGQQLIPEHYLVNRVLYDTTTGRHYVVMSVRREWLNGWFVSAALRLEGSQDHCRTCAVENLSSEHPDVLAQLEVFKTTLLLV